MGEYRTVLVHIESRGGAVAPISRELLTLGRKVALDLRQSLAALVAGGAASSLAEELFALGAETVYEVNAPELDGFHPEVHAQVVEQACRTIAPSTLLMGHTILGGDIAPRVAARLGTTVFTSCIDVRVLDDGRTLACVRPVYAGKALAELSSSVFPLVVTVRPRSNVASPVAPPRAGAVVPLLIKLEPAVGARLVQTVDEPQAAGVRLEEARAIVCGGGGIGSASGFQVLRELAEVLHGAVGVTRVPCDEGWMPLSLEIGQTGKIVAPDLYLAIGVSGAPQHIAGCLGSKYIVAINRDPNAPIFRVSDLGVVGDYRQIVPALIEACRKAAK